MPVVEKPLNALIKALCVDSYLCCFLVKQICNSLFFLHKEKFKVKKRCVIAEFLAAFSHGASIEYQ